MSAEIARTLRELYAPPADAGYWRGLEQRIMARIAGEGPAWWEPFGGWVRAGIVAACAAGLIIGIALARARQEEAQLAYETVIETPRTLPQQIATGTSSLPVREVTLQYVLSP
ncbi:MAG TPA: hypothetical protein VFK13_12365 [Gemmatimonadaceae bacterium]|nr:hypothetical protein [Gemmatimonadaceae bacterium]